MENRRYSLTVAADEPSARSLELIDAAIAELESIGLEDADGWFRGYVENKPESRLAQDLDMVTDRILGQTTICEYGAAPFVYTKALDKSDYQVVGMDIAPDRFSSVEKIGVPIVKLDVEVDRVPVAASTFDVVIFNELFEHLRKDLIFTMEEVYRILKPGGTLFLSTPNLRSIQGIVNFLVRGKAYSCANSLYWEWGKIDMIGHMGHVREYTEQEVVEFLGEIGFETTEVIYRGCLTPLTLKRRLAEILLMFFPTLRPQMILVLTK